VVDKAQKSEESKHSPLVRKDIDLALLEDPPSSIKGPQHHYTHRHSEREESDQVGLPANAHYQDYYTAYAFDDSLIVSNQSPITS